MTSRLRITHRASVRGWDFRAAGHPDIQGGGRTLMASTSAAEHAVRQFLVETLGFDVPLADARRLVEHEHIIRR